jgi:hypothetical protein
MTHEGAGKLVGRHALAWARSGSPLRCCSYREVHCGELTNERCSTSEQSLMDRILWEQGSSALARPKRMTGAYLTSSPSRSNALQCVRRTLQGAMRSAGCGCSLLAGGFQCNARGRIVMLPKVLPKLLLNVTSKIQCKWYSRARTTSRAVVYRSLHNPCSTL